MTVVDIPSGISSAGAAEIQNIEEEDFDAGFEEQSFTKFNDMAKTLALGSSKLEKQGRLMRQYDNAMKKVKSLQDLFLVSGINSHFCECFRQVLILHEKEGVVSESVRKTAFDYLREAFGFESCPEREEINDLHHVYQFTLFLQEKIKESVSFLLALGVNLDSAEYEFDDELVEISFEIELEDAVKNLDASETNGEDQFFDDFGE